MNEQDKEFAKQAWTENDWDGHVDIPKLIELIRADEREACATLCEEIGRELNCFRLAYKFVTQIRARGKT